MGWGLLGSGLDGAEGVDVVFEFGLPAFEIIDTVFEVRLSALEIDDAVFEVRLSALQRVKARLDAVQSDVCPDRLDLQLKDVRAQRVDVLVEVADVDASS